jgi:hypothetical protein
MKAVLEALDVLRAETSGLRARPLSSKADPAKECGRLIKTRDSLRSVFLAPRLRGSSLDPDKVWRRFESASLDDLDGLEVRTLCLADDRAVSIQFVQALHDHPERLNNMQCLWGMVNSYFKRWRTMEAPEELEGLLKFAIANYPHPSPPVEKWRSAQSLFSPQAAYLLAEGAVEQQLSVEGVQKGLYIGKDTRLGLIMQARVAGLATKRFLREELVSDESSNLRYLQWLVRTVFTDSLGPGALHDSVSSLLLSQSAGGSQRFQDAIRQFIQGDARLGDPRLQKSTLNWRDMNPEAKLRVLAWLVHR